ncbi:MAG: DUF134 domain-containing protein [Candidatus Odinarchaeia archaeon]
MGWRHRRGRPWKIRNINLTPPTTHFTPTTPPKHPPITLHEDELEALRLVDLENLTQEEAGKQMNISRGTIWRLVKEGRKKLVQMIIEGRELYITPKTPIKPKQNTKNI